MRFAIGAAVVDVIVDDDDYRLPLAGSCPASTRLPWRGIVPC